MTASAASASLPCASSAEWIEICRLEQILPDTGVCALVRDTQIAVFRVGDHLYALGNHALLSRGLIGDRGGVLTVASPIFKQRFALATGVCLDDPSVSVHTYACRVRHGVVEIAYPG